jgi:hypothetical protein
VALVLVTVAATVPVVLQLALVVRHTTTRSVPAPTWNQPSPITPRPLLLSLRLNNSNHPQTPLKVALAKLHVAAMVVLPQLVHSRVLTVERRPPPSGVATMSGTTFATLVVRRLALFGLPPPRLHKMSLSPHCCVARSHGAEILNYLIRLRNTDVRFGLVVYTTDCRRVDDTDVPSCLPPLFVSLFVL